MEHELPRIGELRRDVKGDVSVISSRDDSDGDGVRELAGAGDVDCSEKKWRNDGSGDKPGECDGDGVHDGSGDVGADECNIGYANPCAVGSRKAEDKLRCQFLFTVVSYGDLKFISIS